MKKLFILSILGLFLFASCSTETELSSAIPNAKSDPDSTDQQYNLNVLYLSMIDPISEESIRESLLEIISNQEDEYLYISDLRAILDTDYSLDLLASMESSALNHGVSTMDIGQLEAMIDSFQINGNWYRPYIYIPFSEDVSPELAPAICYLNNLNLSSISFMEAMRYDVPADTWDEVEIDESFAEQYMTLMIGGQKTIDLPYGPKALPWRRCWCGRAGAPFKDRATGEQVVTSGGTCVMHNGNSIPDSRCSRCGRADSSGECDGDNCRGC